MTKFKVRLNNRWGNNANIEEVDVEKETEKSVWIKGNRNAKRSDYANYYDSWEEAHSALLDCQQRYVDSLMSRLQRANSALENIKGMRP